jgi:2-amino-4-hydroxy-6-hydroxymethyldihydropteridine diphosphokinase
LVLDSVLGPVPLLGLCHRLERAAGRRRRERWGPRELDLDVLLYGDAEIMGENLTVPHPRLHERRFALAPLVEIWPDAEVPGRGSVQVLLDLVEDQPVRKTELAW